MSVIEYHPRMVEPYDQLSELFVAYPNEYDKVCRDHSLRRREASTSAVITHGKSVIGNQGTVTVANATFSNYKPQPDAITIVCCSQTGPASAIRYPFRASTSVGSRLWLAWNGFINAWEFVVGNLNNEVGAPSTGGRGAFDFLVCRASAGTAYIYRNGVEVDSNAYTGTINNGSTAFSLNGDIAVGMIAVFHQDFGADWSKRVSAMPLSLIDYDDGMMDYWSAPAGPPSLTAGRFAPRLFRASFAA